MHRVVCFDLDGTLIDPNGSIRNAIDAAVVSEGFERFAPEDVLIGMPLRQILRLRTRDASRIEAMVEVFREHSRVEAPSQVRFYPGVLDVVRACRGAGLATAIVTTKGEEEAVHLLGALDILGLFDTVVGDDDVRALKPDPAPVVAACGRLGRRPREACMVGDTVYDIEAGRAAGAYTIGVAWGHGSGSHGVGGADVVVHDADGLLHAIRAWAGG